MVFYKDRHLNRLYFFLSFIGFISALFAILLFLNGNPDFFSLKTKAHMTHQLDFLLTEQFFLFFYFFCLISSFEWLKRFNLGKYDKKVIIFFKNLY